MNWLFLCIAIASAVSAAVTYRRLKQGAVTRSGPVPGYSSTDGRLLRIDPLPELERDLDWWSVRLEEFHSPHRTRVVVEFGVRDTLDLAKVRALVEAAARQIASLTNAHVVYLEALGARGLRAALMLAPDGRGWTGTDATQLAWLVPEELA